MGFVFLCDTQKVILGVTREHWVNQALPPPLPHRSDQPGQVISLDHEGAFYMTRPALFGPGDDVKTGLQRGQRAMSAAPQTGGA